jgi:hypothetical protein
MFVASDREPPPRFGAAAVRLLYVAPEGATAIFEVNLLDHLHLRISVGINLQSSRLRGYCVANRQQPSRGELGGSKPSAADARTLQPIGTP